MDLDPNAAAACDSCHGSGQPDADGPCADCAGTGTVPFNQTFLFDLLTAL